MVTATSPGAKNVPNANDDNDYSGSSGEDDDDDEEDSREMTGRIYTKAGIEVIYNLRICFVFLLQ